MAEDADPFADAVRLAALNRYLDQLTTRQAFGVAGGHVLRRLAFGSPHADRWLCRLVERAAMTRPEMPDNVTELRRRSWNEDHDDWSDYDHGTDDHGRT